MLAGQRRRGRCAPAIAPADRAACWRRRCRREYARALAVLAAKAPRPAWTAFLGRCVHEAALEEDTFHKASPQLSVRALIDLLAGCCFGPVRGGGRGGHLGWEGGALRGAFR